MKTQPLRQSEVRHPPGPSCGRRVPPVLALLERAVPPRLRVGACRAVAGLSTGAASALCLALPALGLTGCGAKIATIEVEESATAEVEAGTILEDLLGDLGFESFLNMDISSAEELANQGVEPGDIQEVRLTSFELEAVDPDGADLSFLEAMSVSVSAPDVEEALLASADSFPEGQALVEFELADLDLAPYVVSQSMDVVTDITGHRPDQTTTVEARFSLDVEVTLRGATRKR